jgi:Protein of unknown function (DUF2439)
MQSLLLVPSSSATLYPLIENDDNRTAWPVNEVQRDGKHPIMTAPPPTQQFACLFTKHKTQKHKIWLDGRLVVSPSSGTVTLYAADPAPGSGDSVLDRLELTRSEIDALLRHQRSESESYLISIEGPWTRKTSDMPQSGAPLVSSGMLKVLTKKFQKPSHKLPPPPMPSNREPKRRRPLQPGELVQQYYGGGTLAASPEPLHQEAVPISFHCEPQYSARNNGLLPPLQAQPVREYHPLPHIAQPQHSSLKPLPSGSESFRIPPNVSANAFDAELCPERLTAPPSMHRFHPPPPAVVAPRDVLAVVPTRNASVHRSNAFVTNAFNSNHFYGDEALEEEEDGAPEAFSLETEGPVELAPEGAPTLNPVAPLPGATLPRDSSSGCAADERYVGPAKLSNTQLLDLFQFSNFGDEPDTITPNANEEEDAFVLPPSNDEEDDDSDASLQG